MKKSKIIRKAFLSAVILGMILSLALFAGCKQSTESVAESTEAVSIETAEATTPQTTMEAETTAEEVTEATPETTIAPAGPSIVFASNRGDDPDKSGLYILDIEKDEITSLNTGIDNVILPKWSPDGTKILFSVMDVWNLYIINADGTELTQLTDFRSNNGDWSPDGMQVVFQSDHQNEPQDTPDIYIIDIEGKNLVEILDEPPVADFGPRWSPDGSRIMFISNRGGNYDVFKMGTDGANIVQVTKSDAPIIDISLSPDSSFIAFTYAYAFPHAADLYIVDNEGSMDSILQVTDNKGAAFNDSPSWSMDGKKIYFSSKRDENSDLWVVNADGSNPVQLTDDMYQNTFPDFWSP